MVMLIYPIFSIEMHGSGGARIQFQYVVATTRTYGSGRDK
jgi:hypothetical protein